MFLMRSTWRIQNTSALAAVWAITFACAKVNTYQNSAFKHPLMSYEDMQNKKALKKTLKITVSCPENTDKDFEVTGQELQVLGAADSHMTPLARPLSATHAVARHLCEASTSLILFPSILCNPNKQADVKQT